LKLKHELKVIKFPRRVVCYLCFHGWTLRKGGCLPHPAVAERVNARWQYSSESNYISLSPWVCFESWYGAVVQCDTAEAFTNRQKDFRV